jgi:hypothetical protein
MKKREVKYRSMNNPDIEKEGYFEYWGQQDQVLLNEKREPFGIQRNLVGVVIDKETGQSVITLVENIKFIDYVKKGTHR